MSVFNLATQGGWNGSSPSLLVGGGGIIKKQKGAMQLNKGVEHWIGGGAWHTGS